jgi:hypothetical protein
MAQADPVAQDCCGPLKGTLQARAPLEAREHNVVDHVRYVGQLAPQRRLGLEQHHVQVDVKRFQGATYARWTATDNYDLMTLVICHVQSI